MSYFSRDYFGVTTFDALQAGDPAPTVAPPVDPVSGPITDGWQLLAWMRFELVTAGIFDAGQVAIGRTASSTDETRPRAWIYPVGFNDRNDAVDLASRTATIALSLGVPYSRPGDDDLTCYRELERIEGLVTTLLEPGPPGVNPTLGGLLKGTYDTPAGQKQSANTPLGFMLAVTLFYSFNYDRIKD